MIEYLVVGILVLLAVIYIINNLKKTIDGKNKCNSCNPGSSCKSCEQMDVCNKKNGRCNSK